VIVEIQQHRRMALDGAVVMNNTSLRS
jgi:hypothetical protein